jgi:uncharacterized protein (DUF2252 family)
MSDCKPCALADRQIELDRDAAGHTAALLRQKKSRLATSPHGFLRGSAPLFHRILTTRPDLAAGPAGMGWIAGDMHLENVGAYRNDADQVVFALNDFDDGTIGPLHLDVLRLSTSVILAGRGFHATGADSIAFVERLIGAYLAARSGSAAPPEPEPVRALVDKVKNRSRQDLLDKRAPLDKSGRRRFERGERYLDLPPDIVPRIPEILAAYVAALGPRAPGKAAKWVVEDAAQRVAGNGSLGVLRIALLVRDHDDGERLIELKECRASSTEALFQPPLVRWTHHAERAVQAANGLLAAPPRHLAAFEAAGRSFAGRRLFPQEDKLALDKLVLDRPASEAAQARAAITGLVQLVGHLLGAAHAHGVAALGEPPPQPWNDREVAALVDHAIELAGMMESVYLAWVRRAW